MTREELSKTAEAQQEQAGLLRDAARLTAIGHIYDHYSDKYGSRDETGILSAVAAGHRRWAMRESFGMIDSIFDEHREQQVRLDYAALMKLLESPEPNEGYFAVLSAHLGSLLIDARLSRQKREPLWGLYELVRSSPTQLLQRDSNAYNEFACLAHSIAKGQHLTQPTREHE